MIFCRLVATSMRRSPYGRRICWRAQVAVSTPGRDTYPLLWRRVSSLMKSLIGQQIALKGVEQQHLEHQKVETNKKHDAKLRDTANKLEELLKLLPAQPPLPKPAHITIATGSTPEAAEKTACSSKMGINDNLVERGTTNEKKKVQGLHKKGREEYDTGHQCQNSSLHALQVPQA